MLQRHDDSPPGKPDAGHQARPDGGVPSVSNCSSAIFRDLSFVRLIHMIRIEEVATLASLALFLGMVAIWAQVIATL
jgi:hypothetical protein